VFQERESLEIMELTKEGATAPGEKPAETDSKREVGLKTTNEL
jgi:hypothetical protein